MADSFVAFSATTAMVAQLLSVEPLLLQPHTDFACIDIGNQDLKQFNRNCNTTCMNISGKDPKPVNRNRKTKAGSQCLYG